MKKKQPEKPNVSMQAGGHEKQSSKDKRPKQDKRPDGEFDSGEDKSKTDGRGDVAEKRKVVLKEEKKEKPAAGMVTDPNTGAKRFPSVYDHATPKEKVDIGRTRRD